MRTPITTWPKQQNNLWYTLEEAHLCSNGPQKQLYYHRSPYARSDIGPQAGDRLFRTAIHQQLPRLIPVYHPFMDLPHITIHIIKESIYRRNYRAPSTTEIE